MSKLKAIVARKIDDGTCDPVPCVEVYLKSEADKVLAEKDKEIALLKERICNGDVSRLTWIDDCLAKDKEIARLEEERRWRKCSEEMPEDGTEVIASDGDGIWFCYKTTMCDGSSWFQPDGQPHIEGITHWMPLPSTPKEADK